METKWKLKWKWKHKLLAVVLLARCTCCWVSFPGISMMTMNWSLTWSIGHCPDEDQHSPFETLSIKISIPPCVSPINQAYLGTIALFLNIATTIWQYRNTVGDTGRWARQSEQSKTWGGESTEIPWSESQHMCILQGIQQLRVCVSISVFSFRFQFHLISISCFSICHH